jgi:hypothetical protein
MADLDKEALGTIRVCPERDAICPHGLYCPYNRGWSCDMEASRAALRKSGRPLPTPPEE